MSIELIENCEFCRNELIIMTKVKDLKKHILEQFTMKNKVIQKHREKYNKEPSDSFKLGVYEGTQEQIFVILDRY